MRSGRSESAGRHLGETLVAAVEAVTVGRPRHQAAAGPVLPRQVQRGAAGQDGRGNVRQGMLEASNVNVVEELVDMIECQRAYETNSKMIQATDDMLKYVNQNV